ncbi:glycosyltransferase [Sulfurospirillum oryzae]|uniref:glycosyltransferase n=1 Tax=Sulfurospirillum oryzae TaxID=2976535 RepID=UPI0021E95422|nr:glycosyltransferase [Sulfurospirillum oryzae]
MKKALVIDWLDKYAGSERTIKSLESTFDFDKCYTLVNIMWKEDLKLIFKDKNIAIENTCLQYFGKYFRYFLIFFPYFTRKIKIDKDINLLISSSHAVSKAVLAPHCLHISYFQARNLKYIWEEQDLYFKGIKSIFKVFIPYLQKFDLDGATRPNYIIANSHFVQDWVYKIYKRDSEVIYPPVDVTDFLLSFDRLDYYVTVGRLEQYKRFDIIVEAFSATGKRLIVIGDGSQKHPLQTIASGNVEFIGFLPKADVINYVSKAKAFVFAGVEDFGIAAVEAQACGTPVICLGQGGTKETVIDGITGVHFKNQTVKDLIEAIEYFEQNHNQFDPHTIRKNALRFSKERFEKEINKFVNKKLQLHGFINK